jgi:hypothetical protein
LPKKIVLVIVIVAALLAFSEVITPWTVSFLLDRALSKAMPARQMVVSARSYPGIFLWFGQFDEVRAAAADAKLDGLNVQEVRVTLDDARMDMGDLITKNRVTVKEVRNLEIEMKVNEKDLAAYIGAKVKEARSPSVKILKDKIELRSDVDLGIVKLSIVVDGRIVGDAQSIRFRSDRLEIKNSGGVNFGALFSEIQLVDLTHLPFKAGVRKVVMEPGVITIAADNHF